MNLILVAHPRIFSQKNISLLVKFIFYIAKHPDSTVQNFLYKTLLTKQHIYKKNNNNTAIDFPVQPDKHFTKAILKTAFNYYECQKIARPMP